MDGWTDKQTEFPLLDSDQLHWAELSDKRGFGGPNWPI